MADVSIPGVKSRFDTEKLIERLMKVERVPKERLERTVETLETQKLAWQSLGRRIQSLRDGASALYSYQNPFNDRLAQSSDTNVLEASAGRDVQAQEHNFIVKQTASGDKFVSKPLDDNFEVGAGKYKFSAGENETEFDFSGGSISDFSEALNSRGKGKFNSYFISIKPKTRSFVFESLAQGKENYTVFGEDALPLAQKLNLVREIDPKPVVTNIKTAGIGAPAGESLRVAPQSEALIPLQNGFEASKYITLNFDAALAENPDMALLTKNALEKAERARIQSEAAAQAYAAAQEAALAKEAEFNTAREAGSADSLAAADVLEEDQYAEVEEAADAGGAEEGTADVAEQGLTAAQAALSQAQEANEAAQAALTAAEAEVPERVDSTNVLTLNFADGTSVELAPLVENGESTFTYNLADFAGSGAGDGEGKTAVSIGIKNGNTHNDVIVNNISITDATPKSNTEPVNAISKAQDALFLMDGIEIERDKNEINDIIPGLNLKLRSASEEVVTVKIENDTEAIKDAVISFVGNYNRLMVEINVLTRSDEKILDEVSYLNDSEREDLKKRMGLFAGEPFVAKLKTELINIVSAPYQTTNGTAILANFGISSDVRRAGAGGYDPSRTRGYLEIDEKVLDEAISVNADTLHQIMGRDSDGDFVTDSGVAYSIDRVTKPFVETGGVIAAKTNGITTNISQDKRRIDSIDRQLEQKEAALRRQYGQMEDAYNRMERMSNSLDSFNNQNSGKR